MKKIKDTLILACMLGSLPFASMFAQEKTTFTKVGNGAETEQEFFPGQHRARPVLGDYTNSGKMGLFSAGQEPKNWSGSGEWAELATLAYRNDDGGFTLDENTGLSGTTYANAVFFDYNNDGNLDLFVMGGEKDENKKMELYRNLGSTGSYHFEKVADAGFAQRRDEDIYLNPISVGDFNHDGYTDVLVISHDGNRHIDLYLNDKGTGKFIAQGELSLEAVSKGSVTFGDLNNDGWLDMVYCGYGNGGTTKIYINNQDGTFNDSTPEKEIMEGVYESQTALADFNGDGTLDIITTGNFSGGHDASIYYNTITEGKCSWQHKPAAQNGLTGVKLSTPLIADFNGDGKMDIILNGEEHSTWNKANRVYYQDAEGKFVLDTDNPLIATRDGGINMGDANGDGNMDLIIGGYKDAPYNTPLRVYENTVGTSTTNTFPQAPGEVTVSMENGELTITWTKGSDAETAEAALRYNLYVKNNTTGETYTMIPADIETGKLKVGTDLQTSLSSAVNTYKVKAIGEGNDFTVGVQTLDQAYAGSTFKTAKTITVDISDVEENNRFNVISESNGLTVRGTSDRKVTVYTMDGKAIRTGNANTLIPLTEKGIYLIQIEGESTPLKCIY